MNVGAINTRIFRVRENLLEFVADQLGPEPLPERTIVAITSKIVSLAEGRLVSASIPKPELIEREADHNLGPGAHGCFLTIKHGVFIPSAGIDESNSEHGHYILYPEDPFESARKLCEGLKQRWDVRELGVLMTDSHTTPLRRGVTGLALAHWGFRGVRDLVGTPDLFGRKVKMTQVNVADALAAVAVLLMGETHECRPLALIQGSDAEFTDQTDPNELRIPVADDLYFPLFRPHLRS